MTWLRLLPLCISCSLFACTSATENVTQQERFFDLSQYFNEQVTHLAAQKEVQKEATINGTTEAQTVTNPDFQQELQLFIDSDINRTSWLDKYAVDSILNTAGQLTELVYTALEDQLRTRRVAIAFADNQVNQVDILNATDNVIAQTKQELSYTPQNGYIIKSFQDILFTDPRTLEVSVSF